MRAPSRLSPHRISARPTVDRAIRTIRSTPPPTSSATVLSRFEMRYTKRYDRTREVGMDRGSLRRRGIHLLWREKLSHAVGQDDGRGCRSPLLRGNWHRQRHGSISTTFSQKSDVALASVACRGRGESSLAYSPDAWYAAIRACKGSVIEGRSCAPAGLLQEESSHERSESLRESGWSAALSRLPEGPPRRPVMQLAIVARW